MSSRIGNWQQTYTGRQFWPLDPRPEDVEIKDIAHGLSLICRFGGQCRYHYSVAQHSVLVCRAMTEMRPEGTPGAWMFALLHDAAEAYIGDVIRPFKAHISEYAEIEAGIIRCVLERFGVPKPNQETLKAVKLLDDRACATEARDLMSSPPAMWWSDGRAPEPFRNTVEPWCHTYAKDEFLRTFYALRASDGPATICAEVKKGHV